LGSYVNFMAEYEDDRVRAVYGPDKYVRLGQIKGAYDPDNLFHLKRQHQTTSDLDVLEDRN
jgi:hypothetical protein